VDPRRGFVLTVAGEGRVVVRAPAHRLPRHGATQAIRWSVYAAISNLVPMVLYGILLGIAMLVALIPWASVSSW
jgi:uncharacterized membrane protein